MTISHLKVTKELPHDEKVLQRFEEAVKEAREFLKANAHSGFVLIRYARKGLAEVAMEGDAYTYDPMDYFFLPDYAKAHIERLRETAR